ncbi:MAG: M23 family metallopeptidase [Acidobacteria bacterium]|nr:M23 family metallopeptidase [Acidobacteriota bacterium]
MTKDDKSYSFLLKHSSRSKIYIKRVEIPKSIVHFGSVSVFLVLGLSVLGLGISTVLKSNAFAETGHNPPTTSQVSQTEQSTDIDYSRPSPSSDYALNSGGPEGDTEADGEDAQIDNEIAAIRKTADPAFLPTMWAHLGKINNEFGFRRNPFGGRSYEFHPGMDIDGERGDLVVAPANGTVIKAGWTNGYGNMVEIDHGNGIVTRYGHMMKLEAEVGEQITRGQLIGYIGSTGRSTGPHLHFEVRLNDKPINPRHFLPQEPTDLNSIPK